MCRCLYAICGCIASIPWSTLVGVAAAVGGGSMVMTGAVVVREWQLPLHPEFAVLAMWALDVLLLERTLWYTIGLCCGDRCHCLCCVCKCRRSRFSACVCALYHVALNLAAWLSILTSTVIICIGTLVVASMGLLVRACDPAADAVARAAPLALAESYQDWMPLTGDGFRVLNSTTLAERLNDPDGPCNMRGEMVGAGELLPAGAMVLLVAQVMILTGFVSTRSAVEAAASAAVKSARHEREPLIAEVETIHNV